MTQMPRRGPRVSDPSGRHHAANALPSSAPTSSRSRCPGADWLNQQWGAQLFLGSTYRLGGWNAIVLLHASVDVARVRVHLPGVPSPGRVDADRRAPQRRRLLGGPAEPGHASAADRASCSSRSRSGSWRAGATHPRALWVVPALMLVWVNVHGSFVLAPLLLGLAWLEDRKDSPGHGSHDPRRVRARASSPRSRTRSACGVWAYAASDRHEPHDQARVTEWAPPTDPRVQRGRLLRVRAW